ncbi:FtsX-like permease family protein [Acetobacterium wieringae]|uniref:FtsX-like permease family protein n=1 Tax=Acetobacterium wieringae TaxID=52694 RepID=A0A1F2PJD1_9FIRM|nr:ABC transporter permease [Acetobacterium wieringae]OFV71459.1 FtsX-like permease family protein [Acetobacterium wieringae]
MKLLLNLVRKDFKRNRVITTALAVFLILSAIFMAGGLRVTGIMLSSLNGLNKMAVPPEYVQMHKGDYDEQAVADFVAQQDYLEDALVVRMLDVNNAQIICNGESLEKCLMDKGLVTQNENFDYLLDQNNQIAIVKDGEIGVPVYYAEDLNINVGDTIVLQNGAYQKKFKVATIIRDSTMNSSLSYSKRFLISTNDLNEVALHMGEWEYCFEFLLKEGVSTTVLENAYLAAGLPSNGVAVTAAIFNMINAFSYGLVALVILVISLLLITMSVLCLSYIIRATLAEENHAIGEMKAIGIPAKDIIKLYQIKYTIMVVGAGMIGYLAAIPFGDFFSATVIRYCGDGSSQWMQWITPLVGIVLLSLFVIYRCHRIIQKHLKRTVMELIRGEENTKQEGHYRLPAKALKAYNLSMALGELKCKWKENVVIFLIFVFSSFLILLPMNMNNTINNPVFLTYMGIGKSDVRIDIQYSNNLEQQKEEAIAYLENDPDIERYTVYQNGYVQSQNVEGEWEYVRVQNGDNGVFPLEYLEGKAPTEKNDLALSYLNAVDLGKKVGDAITIIYQGKEHVYNVCGIYQDITYGGKTAKAAIDFDRKDIEGYMIYLDLREGIDIDNHVTKMRTVLPNSKITPCDAFVFQTLSSVIANMNQVQGVAAVISLMLTILITVMFLQLMMAREHSAIALKKAIGFSTRDIQIQLGIRLLVIQVLAIIAGTLLANTLGEVIFAGMLATVGVTKIKLLIAPLWAYLLCPAVQLGVVVMTVIIGTNTVGSYHIRDQIME